MSELQQQVLGEVDRAQKIFDLAAEFLVQYGFQVLGAILILVFGYFVAKKLSALVLVLLEKKSIDVTLRSYAARMVYLLVLFCFVVIALGKFGISIAPFVAALGAVTLGIGLALQGVVSNYGAGLAIIAGRPFKVGDTLTVINVSGLVKEIKLGATIIETEDQEEITIPNKHIVGEVLLNTFESRLVEVRIGIAYHEDPHVAAQVILEALRQLDFVTAKPMPQVGVDHFADSAIVMGVRAWVPTRAYTEYRYKLNLAVLRSLQHKNIQIPFPQLDVRQSHS